MDGGGNTVAAEKGDRYWRGGSTRMTRGVGYGDGVYLRNFKKKKNVGCKFTRLLERGNTRISLGCDLALAHKKKFSIFKIL
jgi:hypothetical protein